MTWGSNLFHVGILVIFLGHFVGLLTPVLVFEALGIAMASSSFWRSVPAASPAKCCVGIALLAHRRLFDPHPHNIQLRRYRDPARCSRPS